MQQCRHWRRGGPFHHQLAMGHDPDHGVKDIAVRQGHNVVHEALDHREGVLSHPLHAQAVNDAIDLVQRDHVAGFNTFLHRWTIGRLHANDLDLWIIRLERHRDTGDQPAASDGNYGNVNLRKVLEYLKPQRSLAGNELHVVKWMDVRQPAFLAELP